MFNKENKDGSPKAGFMLARRLFLPMAFQPKTGTRKTMQYMRFTNDDGDDDCQQLVVMP